MAFIKHVLFVTETHAFFTTDKLATMPARGVMLSLKFESKLDWPAIAKKIEDGRAAARAAGTRSPKKQQQRAWKVPPGLMSKTG